MIIIFRMVERISESVVAVGFTDVDASIGQLHRQYLQ
jgi:hypothetical protein